ncbi:MAG TPA: SOS response-associated peptidase [Thermoanaerobaculia bacterium]|jgi:putative SOS response-associated peptidase YedK
MCGRYTLTDPGDIVTELNADASGVELAPRYNISPTQNVPIVRAGKEGGREVRNLRWGLIPFWAKEAAIGNRMINARAETVGEKPAYKASLTRRRCLVLADGFYEWKKERGGKQPYHIHLVGQQPFAMAGLWDRWTKGEEGPIESFTIITTDANQKVAELHNRMPVILDAEARERWLDPELADARELVSLLRPFDDERIDFYPVSKLVNSPSNERPECVQPIELEV